MVARMPGKRAVENFYWLVAHLGIVLIKYISKKKWGKFWSVFYNCVELNTMALARLVSGRIIYFKTVAAEIDVGRGFLLVLYLMLNIDN